tara:strand:+ start:134 stop:712 length:579 start_codon:yes stop_codon:yes gene_type:complete
MARNITSAFNTAITNTVVRPIFAVELDLSTGILRFWNGLGDITMTAGGSSQTFTGLGDLMSISAIEESTSIKANNVSMSLSGIKSSLISSALGANYTNRNASVYIGLFDTSKNVIADVYTIFKGKMDVMQISEDGDTSVVTLKCENRLITLDRANERRYTLEDQKIDFPSDLGFEFIPDLQDKQIVWGKETS